ncbi:Calx-beta domain-containing protein [Nitrosomonas sp. wSCUT-2]
MGSHVVVESDMMEALQSYNIKSYGFMDSIDDAIEFTKDDSPLPVEVMLYLSEDNIFDASDIPFKGGTELIEAPTGEILEYSTTFPIPQWIDNGDYYLFSVFDPDNLIAEDIESDNVTTGTNVTIVNNLTRTITAANDVIDLSEGNSLSVNILSNDRTSIDQEMIVQRFEGDFVGSAAPFIGKIKGGLGYSIASDGTLNLDTSTLNFDLMPGEIRTETLRYELKATSDGTSDLGEVTISIRDPNSDTIRVTPDDATVKETDGKIEFALTRSGGRVNTEETIYVTTTQEYGSTNNSDYTSLLKQPFTFSANEATKTIPVNILPDSVTESDESFGLIIQANPTDPSSTFLTSTTFTIQNSTATITKPTGFIPVGDEILVDIATKNDQSDPQVTTLLNGGFVVTWKDVSDKAIKAQAFATDGSRMGNAILVNTATQNNKLMPQITALPDGGFVITWKDQMPGIGGASGDSSFGAIKAQVFDADGGKVSSEILVNTATESDQSFPKITALQNGGFVITWYDLSQGIGGASGDSNDSSIKAQAFAADGSKLGGEILVNTATQNTQSDPQITALRDGGFAITWVDYSHGIGGASGDSSDRSIKAQAFAVDGSKSGGEILVNTATQNSQEAMQITALSNGGFVITWNDFSYGVGGTSGDFSGGIKAQVFAADGSKVGNEILANTATHNGQHDTQITSLPGGGFVITWVDYSHGIGGASGDSSDTAIKAQVFTDDGSKLGGEILVNTATQNDQQSPQITALPDGGFVITWIDFSHGIGGASGDSSDMAIKAQAFTADGSKLGGEILVNTATQNDQRYPQTAALPDGGFVVAWMDSSQDEDTTDNFIPFFDISGFAIKAQVFNENFTVSAATPDRLFNWAESAFDSFFPNHTISQEVEGFYARIYENGNILGELNNHIYFYDSNAITINLVGTTNDFLPDAITAGF